MKRVKRFEFKRNPETGEMWVETDLQGKSLLTLPSLNKGTAFSEREREEFGLLGKLPFQIESLEEQKTRAYQQYKSFRSNIGRHSFLKNLHNINETLFYRLVRDNLNEMLPIIYTPTVGEAVMHYSEKFLSPRGLYVAYPDRYKMREILHNRTNSDIDIIVVSDAEGVLGIGDQGVGGIEIPVAKLMVYTLCAGINPGRYLPVFLDAGTNNKHLLEDPLYLGWRHERVRGEKYDEMVQLFIEAVKAEMPDTFLHWEDFGRDNARKNLLKYQNEICSFNDDMQGTAAVALAALISASKHANIEFCDQKFVIFGSGTAGIGIADEIVNALVRLGFTKQQAYDHFWCIDKDGLLIDDQQMMDFQRPYARTRELVKDWSHDEQGRISLLEVVKQAKPTTLIGCSSVANAFSDDVILEMADNIERPIIFTLSNPTSRCERIPQDIIRLTEGRALIATGSPFDDVGYKGKVYRIAQSNNALVFPGIGLGIVAIQAKRFTENMLWAACKALANYSTQDDDALLPKLSEAYSVSRQVAFAVARQAIEDGVAEDVDDIWRKIDHVIWEPKYYPYYVFKEN
ncbi:NAD-dependent malic enzyme [Fastidiosibacter lacustris]|uniref:NAD-dependent malic enzyme n=1 Tax=Fastidiosibacter lacustris TaxID=2056695 RepID=UPI000E353CE1|nr:NAD-dependent malic enzyme [Fastidiosibacter lacustris]